MADGKISEFLAMQHTLAAEKGWLKNRNPDHAPMSILWSIDELGEAIAIIKKKGSHAIMDNPSVRAHFTEEVADVFMYLFDMMESYGITAEEFTDAYFAKFRRNLGRDWEENEAMYETSSVKRLIFSMTLIQSAPEQCARMVEVLSKTDVELVLLAHTDPERIAQRLADTEIAPEVFAHIAASVFDGPVELLQRALAGEEKSAAAVFVCSTEEAEAAREVGVRTISFADDGLAADCTCQDLLAVPKLLSSI